MVKTTRALMLSLLAALALAGAAQARPAERVAGGPGSLELVDGEGVVVLRMTRASALGQIEEGSIRIAGRGSRLPDVQVVGAEPVFDRKEQAVVYRGENLRFSIRGLGWRVVIRGEGINLSAFGRGFASLRGEGLLSIDSGPFEEWPQDAFRTIPIGG
jgi:hypothetical protein